MSVDEAVNIIANTVSLPSFQPTSESQQKIDDLALKSQAQVALFEYPSAEVGAHAGRVSVRLKAPLDHKEIITANVESILKQIDGVKDIDVHLEPYY